MALNGDDSIEKELFIPRHFAPDVFIEEIEQTNLWQGKNIKVTGEILGHTLMDDFIQVICVNSKDENHILRVDTTLIDDRFMRKTRILYHFLGELDYTELTTRADFTQTVPILKAQTVLHCDGLDRQLYVNTVKARRNYFKSRSTTQNDKFIP
ncbi:Uncharacterised protein r2_g394 [Pycnogonum litorale]